jgi:hypothetical protein
MAEDTGEGGIGNLAERLAAVQRDHEILSTYEIDRSADSAHSLYTTDDPRKYYKARYAAAQAQTPEDELATVRTFYPAAILRRHGGESVSAGLPGSTPLRAEILIPDPSKKKLVAFKPPGLEMGDLQEHAAPAGRAAAYIATAIGAAALAPATGGLSIAVPILAGTAASQAVGVLAEQIGKHLGTVDTRPIAQKIMDRVSDVVTDLAGGAMGEVGGRALQAGQDVLKVHNVAGAGAAGRGKPEVLAAAQRLELPEEGLAPLVTGAKGMQGRAWQLMRNPKTASEFSAALKKTDDALSAKFGDALEQTGGQATTRGEAGASVRQGMEETEGFVMKGRAPDGAADVFRGLRAQGQLEDAFAKSIGGPKESVPLRATHAALEELAARANPAGKAAGLVMPKELEGLRQAIAGNEGTLPMDTVRALRSKLGEQGGAHTLLPSASPELDHIYGAITTDLERFAKAKGGTALTAWNKAQDNYREWAARRDVLRGIAGAQSFEQAFAQAASGATVPGKDALTGISAPVSRLAVVRRTVSPDQWNDLVRVKLMTLGMKGEGESAEFNAAQYLRGWANLSDESKRELFPKRVGDTVRGSWVDLGKPNDLRVALDDLATVAKSRQDFMGARDPGTAGAIEQQKGLKQTALNIALLPISAPLKALGGQFGLTVESKAKLMTDPRFVRWLADSNSIAATDGKGLALHVGRLAGIATAQHLEPEVRQFIRVLREHPDLQPAPEPEPRGVLGRLAARFKAPGKGAGAPAEN